MFLRSDYELAQGGGAAAIAFGRSERARLSPGVRGLRADFSAIDWTPDLGARIGSRDWWRGLATCTSLIAAAWWLTPGLRPIAGVAPAPLAGEQWDEARAHTIAPLAWGATTGHRMAANDLVRPLAETPERPIIDLTATLGSGDRFGDVLRRAGVGGDEARLVSDLIGRKVALDTLRPGMQIDLTLGRRPSKTVPRPIEAMRFRARFDLAVAVARTGGALVVTPQPIAIDHTPLRIRGLVGQSLYRSARAAGAPAKAVEAYIRAIASRISIGNDVQPDNIFDITLEQQRAATGEVRLGQLLYAGLNRNGRTLNMFRWTDGDQPGWFDANGVGDRKNGLVMPVAGRLTSNFGMRWHPVFGGARFHKGVDIGAPYGAPIRAATDGMVAFAGRSGGYGNFVKLSHSGGLATGYGHMSRIAVAPGTRVAQGQVIGYVGSTGLSTGPHLHYELWQNGRPVNPRSIALASVQRLTGDALRAFRARNAALMAVQPAGR
ncbi:MAG: M23 family metallopeptidase [Sphingomonas sp.]|uniref:M23 family metallopeptidase n=1 Tax=Sphingomonas sp. TaxID=28214 RepID=UPI0017FB0BD3|nr:M23 family metallopeptidase [Sphingomonas sp.]